MKRFENEVAGSRPGPRGTFAWTAVLLAVVVAGSSFLVPRVEGLRGKGKEGWRLSWYLCSGQALADARTLGAAFKYMMEVEPRTLPPALPQPAAPSQIAASPMPGIPGMLAATNFGTNTPAV